MLLVLQDQLDQVDNWDQLDKTAYLAQLDRQVNRVHLGNQVHQDQEETLVLWDRLGLRDPMVHQVLLERKVG